jgi:hypothetical protein
MAHNYQADRINLITAADDLVLWESADQSSVCLVRCLSSADNGAVALVGNRPQHMSQALAIEPPVPQQQRTPVPSEFRGKARALIQRVARLNAPLEQTTKEAFAPLRARVVAGNPTPRCQTMVEAVRSWETLVPRDGRLHVDCQLERKSLHLVETRLTAAEYAKDSWVDQHVGALLISELHMQASKECTKNLNGWRQADCATAASGATVYTTATRCFLSAPTR